MTITLGRTEKYDILAVSPKGNFVKLSAKTAQKRNARSFPLNAKDAQGAAADFYYAFVKLNSFETEPEFWIIPSKRVCPLIKEAHEKWLNTPGRNGKKHKDTKMRTLPIKVTRGQARYYPQNWEKELKKYYRNLTQLYEPRGR